MIKTKSFAVAALGIIVALGMSSCKSKESLYKKAYEKAQQNQQAQTVQPTTPTAPVVIAPVQPVVTPTAPVAPVTTTTTVTTPVVSDANVRLQSESVDIVDGAGLKAYSVVCGSFSLQANATGLQQKLKKKGYAAQIALNPTRKLYRVIASTFADKTSAISSRNVLRDDYPDAWILVKK